MQAAALLRHVSASAAWCQSTTFLDSWGALFLALLGTCTRGPCWPLDIDKQSTGRLPAAPALCHHLSLCPVWGQLVAAGAAGGIVGPLRALVLLETSPQTHALHVRKHVTTTLPMCLLGGFLGSSHAENSARHSQLRLRVTPSRQGLQETTGWRAVDSQPCAEGFQASHLELAA